MANTIPFGSKSTQQPTSIPFGGAAPTPQQQPTQSFSDSVWSGLAEAAKGVTDTLGLGGVVNTVSNDIAPAALATDPSIHNKLAAQTYLPESGLGEHFLSGAQLGLTVPAPETAGVSAGIKGGIKSVASRVGKNATLGGAIGATNAASNGGDVIQGTEAGVGLGAVGGSVGEALSRLPDRLVKGVLPKLTKGNESTVLDNTPLGSLDSMSSHSQAAVKNLSGQINTILEHPDYASHIGDGTASMDKVLAQFPNSDYTAETIAQTIKDIAPEQSKLASKVADGTATLKERNTLRQALDQATKKRFTDSPQLTAQKKIAASMADTLRAEVQNHAEETQPVFAKLAKEIDLRNALQAAVKKQDKSSNIGLLDIASYMAAGLPAVLGEKAARSPAVSIGTAKAIKGVAPLVSKFGQPAIAAATTASTQQ